jgi:hypothetical protein
VCVSGIIMACRATLGQAHRCWLEGAGDSKALETHGQHCRACPAMLQQAVVIIVEVEVQVRHHILLWCLQAHRAGMQLQGHILPQPLCSREGWVVHRQYLGGTCLTVTQCSTHALPHQLQSWTGTANVHTSFSK